MRVGFKKKFFGDIRVFFLIFILFICAYNVWVISLPFPHPHPYPRSAPSLFPPPLLTQQKLFCPYL
jgi:hypothetical protein